MSTNLENEMTKTTEELKREMYMALNKINIDGRYGQFDDALEAYLERLRQDSEQLIKHGEILRDAYILQQQRTIQATEEAIRERNRAQAFEFANKSAGEFLQEAQAKVKRQRQSIGQLKNDRDNARNLAGANYTKYQKARRELSELRQLVGSTLAQKLKENVAYTCPSSPDGHEMSAGGMCRHCNEVITRAMS